MKIALVVSDFNFDVTSLMAERARRHVEFLGAEVSPRGSRPRRLRHDAGGEEVAAAQGHRRRRMIGSVIKGDTNHDELIAGAAASAADRSRPRIRQAGRPRRNRSRDGSDAGAGPYRQRQERGGVGGADAAHAQGTRVTHPWFRLASRAGHRPCHSALGGLSKRVRRQPAPNRHAWGDTAGPSAPFNRLEGESEPCRAFEVSET